jgi:hypothetical protein
MQTALTGMNAAQMADNIANQQMLIHARASIGTPGGPSVNW